MMLMSPDCGLDLGRSPALDAEAPGAPAPEVPSADRLYRQGFEAAFGDRWREAADRVAAIAGRSGVAEAVAALRAPDRLIPGAAPSPASEALARALDAEGQDGPAGLRDARVEVRDGLVRVATTIHLYGSGATPEVAALYERGIDYAWNQRPDGQPWTYESASGASYRVAFEVEVRLYDPADPTRGPGLFSGRFNPFNRDNFIRVEERDRSVVFMGDNGAWRSNGRNGLTLAQDNPAAHEFGHLLGLDDRYGPHGPHAGWEGNVMGEPAGYGRVEQRDIDRVVARHVARFERAGLPDGAARRSSIAPW